MHTAILLDFYAVLFNGTIGFFNIYYLKQGLIYKRPFFKFENSFSNWYDIEVLSEVL